MGRNSTSTQPLGWFQLKENKPADERRRPGRHSSPQGGSNETQVHVGTATPAVLGPKARLLTLKLFQILDLRSAPSRALRKCSTAFNGREIQYWGRSSVFACRSLGREAVILAKTNPSPAAAGLVHLVKELDSCTTCYSLLPSQPRQFTPIASVVHAITCFFRAR